MARASGVSLSLRRAGFPVVSAQGFDNLDAVDRLYNCHVRVGHSGRYTSHSSQSMVWIVGGTDEQAQELLTGIQAHLDRKYPPTPVLGSRSGQERPRVTRHPRTRIYDRDMLYVD